LIRIYIYFINNYPVFIIITTLLNQNIQYEQKGAG